MFENYAERIRFLVGSFHSLSGVNREDVESEAILRTFETWRDRKAALSDKYLLKVIRGSIRSVLGPRRFTETSIVASRYSDGKKTLLDSLPQNEQKSEETPKHDAAKAALRDAQGQLTEGEQFLVKLYSEADENGAPMTMPKISQHTGIPVSEVSRRWYSIRNKLAILASQTQALPESDFQRELAAKERFLTGIGLTRGDILNEPRLSFPPLQTMKGALRALREVGHSNEDIREFVLKHPALLSHTGDNLSEHRKTLFEVGHTVPEVAAIEAAAPLVFSLGSRRFSAIQGLFFGIGHTAEEIRSIGNRYGRIYASAPDRVKDTHDLFRSLGYSDDELRILGNKWPQLYFGSAKWNHDRHELLRGHGHTKQEAKGIVLAKPNVLAFSERRITAAYRRLLKHGLTKRQACEVVSQNPVQVFQLNPFKGQELDLRLKLAEKAGKSVLDDNFWLYVPSSKLKERIGQMRSFGLDPLGDHYFLLGNEGDWFSRLPQMVRVIEERGYSPRDGALLSMRLGALRIMACSPVAHPYFEGIMRKYASKHDVRVSKKVRTFLREYFTKNRDALPLIRGRHDAQRTILERIAAERLPRAFTRWKARS